MAEPHERRTPWLLWPFRALWRGLGLVLAAIGRLLCAVLGLVLLGLGVVLTLTLVAAPAGIPIAVLGLLLLLRALF